MPRTGGEKTPERFKSNISDDLNQALELQGATPDAEIKYWRAQLYTKLVKYKEALSDYNEVIKAMPFLNKLSRNGKRLLNLWVTNAIDLFKFVRIPAANYIN